MTSSCSANTSNTPAWCSCAALAASFSSTHAAALHAVTPTSVLASDCLPFNKTQITPQCTSCPHGAACRHRQPNFSHVATCIATMNQGACQCIMAATQLCIALCIHHQPIMNKQYHCWHATCATSTTHIAQFVFSAASYSAGTFKLLYSVVNLWCDGVGGGVPLATGGPFQCRQQRSALLVALRAGDGLPSGCRHWHGLYMTVAWPIAPFSRRFS
jgi:hypothetical protein